MRLKQLLEERKLLTEAGELVLNMKMQLPLCLWLGWFTRYGTAAHNMLGAYNYFNGQYVYYPSSLDRLRPELEILESDLKPNGNSLGWVLAESFKEGDSRQAVLVVDLLGKVPRSQERLEEMVKLDLRRQARTPSQNIGDFASDSEPEAATHTTDANTYPAESLPAHWWVLGLEEAGPNLTPQVLQSWLQTVVNCVGYLRRVRDVSTFHLLLSCPDVFAFFLGQQLNAFGTLKLYEHYTDGYERYEYAFELADAV